MILLRYQVGALLLRSSDPPRPQMSRVSKKSSGHTLSGLVGKGSNPEERPLLCFPPVGGAPDIGAPLRQKLPLAKSLATCPERHKYRSAWGLSK